ncbi:hypothetical protein FO519_002771 [Halicephalobus sp. NKZ332]|nr:hypothetical protein FO519_002771 [Halicephalobus sp. NKZ332]
MRINAYFEIKHAGGAIRSIDFHPTGNKVVTGGCGDGDLSGAVIVWDVSSVFSNSSDIHKLGFVNFARPVNCARYSPSGFEIVVADDANTITILKVGKRTRKSHGRSEESYRVLSAVIGHTFDVFQAEYSPNGSMIASVSADCSAKIWSVEKFPQCLAVLDEEKDGHKESVKGCSWDPFGTYFVTQGSDRSAKIWKTDSWECVFTLSDPFKEGDIGSLFTRMDWTPDGVALILPGASNNSFPTAQMVVRGDWTFEKDFVGHEKSIGIVSICKEMRILQDKSGRKFYGYIVALGGADRSLSVWAIPGSSSRPVVVIHNIVDQPIYDMKWHGRCLSICSRDGTTRFVSFKESEIGQPASRSEFHQHCLKKLGRKLPGFNDEENESEISEVVADKFYLIPEEDDFRWSEESSTLLKKKKKEKPKIEEKKEEVVAPVQLPRQEKFDFDNLIEPDLMTEEDQGGKSSTRPFIMRNTLEGNRITVTDETIESGEHVSKIRYSEDQKTDVEGRVLASCFNKNYGIVLRQKDVITVNRRNGKIKKLYTVEGTPIGLRNFSDFCFVLLENDSFNLL